MGEEELGPLEDGLEDAPEAGEGNPSSWFQRMELALVPGLGKANHSLKAFKPRKDSATTFFQGETPSGFILENLGDLVSDQNGLDYELDANQIATIRELVGVDVPGIFGRLDKVLREALAEGGDRLLNAFEAQEFTNLDKAHLNKDGKPATDVLTYANLLSLNLAQKDPETTEISFNQHVAEAAVMATLEWLMKQHGRKTRHLDNEKVAKKFGLPTDFPVTPKMRERAMSGANMQTVLDEISRTMEILLGITEEPTASVKFTQGIFKAMGANVLELLREGGVVQINDTDVETGASTAEERLQMEEENDVIRAENARRIANGEIAPGDGQKLKRVARNLVTMALGSNKTAVFNTLPDVFTRIFTPAQEKEPYIGAPPSFVAKSQLKNKEGLLSKIEQFVVKRLQNNAHFLNSTAVNMHNVLGRDLYMKLMGYDANAELKEDGSEPDGWHPEAVASQRGKNQSIRSALDGYLGYHAAVIEQIRATTEEGQKPDMSRVWTVPIYFAKVVTKVGRIMQIGSVTPQGDKTVRDLISPTKSVIDATNDASEQMQRYWLAVAQALGVKVEKAKNRAAAVQEAKALLGKGTELRDALNLLKKNLNGAGGPSPFDPSQQLAFSSLVRSHGASAELLHALTSVAELEILRSRNDGSEVSFETFVAAARHPLARPDEAA